MYVYAYYEYHACMPMHAYVCDAYYVRMLCMYTCVHLCLRMIQDSLQACVIMQA